MIKIEEIRLILLDCYLLVLCSDLAYFNFFNIVKTGFWQNKTCRLSHFRNIKVLKMAATIPLAVTDLFNLPFASSIWLPPKRMSRHIIYFCTKIVRGGTLAAVVKLMQNVSKDMRLKFVIYAGIFYKLIFAFYCDCCECISLVVAAN